METSRDAGETLTIGDRRQEREEASGGGKKRRQKEEKGDSRTRSKAESIPRLCSLAPSTYIAITYAKPPKPAVPFCSGNGLEEAMEEADGLWK